MSKSRVDACIESVMADHPGESTAAQAKYFEAVHQELAPLARQLEKELTLARVELDQRASQERDLVRHLRSKLADAQALIKHHNDRADLRRAAALLEKKHGN